MLKLERCGYEVRRARNRRWHALAALVAVGVVACDNGLPAGPPDPGSILVMTETSGFLKPAGFDVLVDGASEGAVEANGQVTISGLEPGSYHVALGGVPDNCVVEGVTVSVEPGETAGVSLNVNCTHADPVTYTIRFSNQRPDLDAQDPTAIISCPFGICPTTEDWDLWAYRNSQADPESEIRQNTTNGVEIAHLPGVTLETLTEADVAGATFTTALVAEPFDAGRVILIRTDLGNVFALGNPVEDLTSSPAVLTFDAALIAEPED
jgi:hypothetical protein